MSALGNLLWFILGGGILSLAWLIIGAAFSITIVGLPVGKACFEFAKLSAAPYGKEIIRETELKGKKSVSPFWRVTNLVLNILWLPIGLILTLAYMFLAIIYAVTIIGIPIAIVYVRMGKFLVFPAGCKVVSKKQALASAVANEMEKRAAQTR